MLKETYLGIERMLQLNHQKTKKVKITLQATGSRHATPPGHRVFSFQYVPKCFTPLDFKRFSFSIAVVRLMDSIPA